MINWLKQGSRGFNPATSRREFDDEIQRAIIEWGDYKFGWAGFPFRKAIFRS